MKKAVITFIITSIITAFAVTGISFSFSDADTITAITLRLSILPYLVLAGMLFLFYRNQGTIQEKLHQRYLFYLLIFVAMPILKVYLHGEDTFNDICSIINNTALTCIAYDFCMYRQPAKCKSNRFVLYLIFLISTVGILFVPIPTNMILTYSAILIWLYVVIALIIDVRRRQIPDRGWIIVAAIFAAVVFIPAYLLETNSNQQKVD